MGHTSVDVLAIGAKGKRNLKGLIVDTGATYTVLSRKILQAIGASQIPGKVPVELGDGKIVKADSYALRLGVGGREGPVIALTFKGAKQVVGVQTLESLGLKVNPITGRLEETRPKGIAYFY